MIEARNPPVDAKEAAIVGLVGALLRSVRDRRMLFVVLLIALVSIFATRAAIHHAADDAAPAAAMELHQDGVHSSGLDAIGVAFGVLLVFGLAFAVLGAASTAAARWSLVPGPRARWLPPPRWRPGPPCRAQLQCFLT